MLKNQTNYVDGVRNMTTKKMKNIFQVSVIYHQLGK